MSDPRFRSSQREALQDAYMADWTADAACRGDRRPDILGGFGRFPVGTVWQAAFTDDLKQRPREQEYAWPEGVLQVMAVCAICTVRRECLEAAYEEERRESREMWSTELIDESRRFGVRGGVPGRMRERFEDEPARLEMSEAWFEQQALKHGWMQAPTMEEVTA